MRFSTVSAIVVVLASALAAAQQDAHLEERAVLAGPSKIFNRDVAPEVTPQPRELEERQLGGGIETQTISNVLQTISGYTPPRSSAIPQPVVPAGTILSANQIPGYNASVNAAASPANNLDVTNSRSLVAFGGGMAAAAAYLLF